MTVRAYHFVVVAAGRTENAVRVTQAALQVLRKRESANTVRPQLTTTIIANTAPSP